MRELYQCEMCDKIFKNKIDALVHEANHLGGIDKLKYTVMYIAAKPVCDYCEHRYYVYGCELDCKYHIECNAFNQYKYFVLDKEFEGDFNEDG